MQFSGFRLLPLGSFSRIEDRKGVVLHLYGPVNKLYCASYDRAMVSYLACLKEGSTSPPFAPLHARFEHLS